MGEAAELKLVFEPPEPDEYRRLRASAGWGDIDLELAAKTLAAARWTVCLRDGSDALAGVARVMGDGALYFFLCDLVLDPAYRGGGLGDRLMAAVTGYFDRNAQPNATIVIIPMEAREGFYERHGFHRTPDGMFGQGMRYGATGG